MSNPSDLQLPSEATLLQQTGWQRPHPSSLCQDHAVLLQVKIFTFDLRNPDFADYLYQRTGLDPSNADCGFDRALELLLCSNESYREAMSKMQDQALPEEDFAELLEIRQLQKAKIQDCWELFVQKQSRDAAPEPEHGLELWNLEGVCHE